MNEVEDYQWSRKMPLLIAAVAAFLVATTFWRRKSFVAAVVAGLFGLLFLWQAHNVRDWCAPAQAKFGALSWGDHSFHEPTLIDCVRWAK